MERKGSDESRDAAIGNSPTRMAATLNNATKSNNHEDEDPLASGQSASGAGLTQEQKESELAAGITRKNNLSSRLYAGSAAASHKSSSPLRRNVIARASPKASSSQLVPKQGALGVTGTGTTGSVLTAKPTQILRPDPSTDSKPVKFAKGLLRPRHEKSSARATPAPAPTPASAKTTAASGPTSLASVAMNSMGVLGKSAQQKAQKKAADSTAPSPAKGDILADHDASDPVSFASQLKLTPKQNQEFENGGFFYLRPRAAFNSVYELRVVDHKNVDPEDYFTLSREGVTHFTDSQAEFTPMDLWEHEFRIFSKMKSISFFARFRVWKNFTMWKRNVRGAKRKIGSEVLQKQLFILNNRLRESLLQIRQMCLSLGARRLVSADRSKTYTLDEFRETQRAHREKLQLSVIEVSDEIRRIVRDACDHVLDEFLEHNEIVADHKMTFMERAALRTECKKLAKFIRLIDFQMNVTLVDMAYSSARSFSEIVNPKVRPKRIVRLAEEKKKEIVIEKKGGAKEAVPLFSVDTAFGPKPKAPTPEEEKRELEEGEDEEDGYETPEDERNPDEEPEDREKRKAEARDLRRRRKYAAPLILQPNYAVFEGVIEESINEAVGVLTAADRLLTHEELAPYTQVANKEGEAAGAEGGGDGGGGGDDLELDSIILNQKEFTNVKRTILEDLRAAVDEALEYARVFEPFRDTYEENASKQQNEVQEFRSLELNVFEELIAKFKYQENEFGGIPISADIGIMQVNSRALKKMLLPSPYKCLMAIKEVIPGIMNVESKELLEDIATNMAKASFEPTTVAEFTTKCKFLAIAADLLKDLGDRSSHIKQFAMILERHKWPVPEQEVAHMRMITDQLNDLTSTVEACEARKEEDTAKFIKLISSQVPKVQKDITALRETLDHPGIEDAGADMEEMVTYMTTQNDKLERIRTEIEVLQSNQSYLDLEVSEFEVLDEVVQDLKVKYDLWTGIKSWSTLLQQWMNTEFKDLDAEEMDKQVKVHNKIAFKAIRGLPNSTSGPSLKDAVNHVQITLPVIVALCSDSLQERHWKKIHDLVGYEIKNVEGFTLGKLMENQIGQFEEEIQGIAVAAAQEMVLEAMLTKIEDVWRTSELELKNYKEQKDVYILGSVEEIVTNLDDSLVTISTIMGSRYVAGIKDVVESWRKKLVTFQETLDEWLVCQRGWMYLETIFSAPDIQRQLPVESKKFFAVDTFWKAHMKRTSDDPNSLKACTLAGLCDKFKNCNETLDKIQKSLEDYLETKRAAFPRFYFLANDELLEILAQTKDPQAVQPHLRKCFDALVGLDFGSKANSIDIEAMLSPEGERIELGKNLKARGNVEDWLSSVEHHMRISLQKLMKVGLLDYPTKERRHWVLEHPGQIVATAAQMTWVQGTESALRSEDSEHAMADWYQVNLDELQALIELIRGDLTKRQRRVIVALVTTDVHARDIVETLKRERISDVGNFTWQMQLRYYWDADVDDCRVRHSDAVINFGYEYQGCTTRLVITPLTDRCWMTITGSYGLKLGAAPAGPAGTGKTESSKDLAKALGVQCIVFNCSDQIDYKMMGKLFRGLAQTGAWTCLDEFNRIDIEVLSVVAQQLLLLRQGRLEGKARIMFMGVDILLKDHHVIVTMNPGYAGRTELPDNLKVCFRPVSMMVPDYALIAEIMLFAEGFGDAKTLSRKMIKLFHLSSQQLSQQPHYDYGLRAVKSVLVMAGGLKRGNPEVSEDVTLIRALRDSNVPKCLSEDLPLFYAIVSDLFPGVVVPTHDYGLFQEAIEQEISNMNLQPVPSFITKIIQQFDVFNVRFGATIVGPTGGGKTTCWKVLQAAMKNMRDRGVDDERYQYAEATVLNPKCITMGELYGEFNELTQEWHDGLASTIMRKAVNDCDGSDNVKRWTVFDGPIDALWIENMNTVLDDNMTLCLANGERIKLKVQMKCLFEVMDLAVASPATVSRLGVMYMAPEDLGWRPLVISWLASDALPEGTPAYVKEHLFEDFDLFVDDALRYMRRNCKEPVLTLNGDLVTALCKLFESLLRPEMGVKLFAKDASANLKEADAKKLVDKLFLFSLVWAVGGTISFEGWDGFNEMIRANFDGSDRKVQIPPGGVVYDYFVDIEGDPGGQWKSFEEIIPSFTFDASVPYFQLLVPSVDTTRYSYVIRQLMKRDRPVFLTGVTGTGKTSVVADTLSRASPLPEDDPEGLAVVPIFMSFSAQTSSFVTQNTIEGKLEKKRKTLLGAPAGRRVVIFVDDVNMPLVEEYGAQPPVELLRQFLDMKGFYDRDKLFWKDIEDTMIMVAAAPPGGGRNPVTPRFKRHFNILCMRPASSKTMQHIFKAILGGFAQAFPNDACRDLVAPIVASVVEIFERISLELLPTPAKSHYTFNLRDVSKVFQGILMTPAKKCAEPDTFALLFMHESMRVFHDRLINIEDKRWFTTLLIELVNRQLKLSMTHEKVFESDWPIMFCDFLRPGLAFDERMYEVAKDQAKVEQVLEDNLDEYNMSNPTQMNLVFFGDAIEHISRIARIIRQPRGNALLIGVGGSGKQSCTRLASFMSDFECFQIELVRGYGLGEFHEDIKELMIKTGVKGLNTVFLFTDTQIVEEAFLEDINNILNSGEIPNLFPQDEMDRILNDMIPVVKEMGIPETRENCRLQFIARVRDLLHIVLCMSPVGDSLRIRCRNFPSLINCTTIDWYMEWPQSALQSVAQRFLAELDVTPEVRESLVSICGEIHTSVIEISEEFFDKLRRRVYTTPKSYLDLIDLYRSMLAEKRQELKVVEKRMEVGVQKLNETNQIVDDLQAELVKLQPVLVVKAAETEKLIEQVNKDKAEAAVVEERVAKDEAVVKAQAAEVGAVQADAQADLDVAMPALNDALKSLDSLDKKDITEIKSFAKPPPAVQTVMEAICILFGSKPDWDNSKKLLNDANFMKNLKEYDKDNIPAAALKKIKKYVGMEIMQVENVRKVSIAATSLCMFVHAMDIYSEVAKEVAPKMAKLKEMNAQMDQANALLAEKQAELQAVRDKVAALQQQLDESLAAKKELEDQSQLTKDRLVRAEKLTSGLESEGVRWKQTLVNIAQDMELLTGDVMISAGCISYYGAFTGPFRKRLVDQWLSRCRELNIPCTEGASLQNTIGNPVQLRAWQIDGLPSDAVSADSALLVFRGKRWPLMIDPQGQANRWIKNTESVNNLEVIKMSNPNLLRSLENGIRVGRPVLIEDLDEHIDPSLEPVLQKAVFFQGGRKLIHLGDSDIDYDDNFKFYMTTKMPNPHYLPEICIKVTLINFTVTFIGLTDQLLGDVVKSERPDVEEKKNKLVTTMAADAKQLKDLEAKILQLLSESTGNILDDEVLINTLADSKTTSAIIHERVEESKKTQVSIEEARASYRPVATRGAIIYFVIADLTQIDPMYQYSLSFVKALFLTSLTLPQPADDGMDDKSEFERRIAHLLKAQTEYIFTQVARGLFETHKSLFASLICFQILLEAVSISRPEFMLMLRGAGVVDRTDMPGPPVEAVDAELLNDAQWDNICAMDRDLKLVVRKSSDGAEGNAEEDDGDDEEEGEDSEDPTQETYRPFAGLATAIAEDFDTWRPWFESDGPYFENMPGDFESQINSFQKLMLVKVVKEESLLVAMNSFVEKSLGRCFVEFPPVQMEDVYVGTNRFTPLIFVLSQGADPTAMLLKFAKEKGYGERLHVISLGQGQGPHAERLIENSVKNGDWVLLQNCHLAKSWMPTLEKIVLGLEENQDVIHEDFRLYLTSFPATYFPVTVLQNGVKLTNEPPKGLRANLIRSFDNNIVSESIWEGCLKPQPWKKLLVGFSFFHALVQERRKFGPLGWNIRYEFNDSDLETSRETLRRFLDEQATVPWDALLYVTGQINYGGRVTDDWDRRCLMGILQKFCNPGILVDEYKFSKSGLYYAPPECSFGEVNVYLKQLPMVDNPEVFGMHKNAEITFQKAESTNMITTMLGLQPRESGGGGGMSSDDIVLDLVAEIEGQVPEFLDKELAGPNTFVVLDSGLISSLDTVLSQEMVKFNKLIRTMNSTLKELARAIKGLVVMSLDLDKMYSAFLVNQVPPNWANVGFASRKTLMSWVKDMIFRVEFLRTWLYEGQPVTFPLQAFFFPQGFMTGTLQTHARKYKVAVDELTFNNSIINKEPEEIVESPEDGVLVYGMWMEGARFNRESELMDQSLLGQMFTALPPVHLVPEINFLPDPVDYRCPVYKTSDRQGVLSTTGMSTNYVLAVSVKTDVDPNTWVMMGCACLLNLDD
ncbi:Dynein heavy chain 1, axonemal [Hondaea fermentalgiana]|uniref:Dynein heavy chain 1, axonemal n=1 Tax=Hondaea fermentalgiana TaxID=2315210 RepID=A0A2R5GGJ0_9STRA|nr:Dynein heavy chain 1, axonemal [Hondaea fermentalgiana]|eukprot:GBG29459.1 Dynein heavy chain 1, axonemal [Hondaea fermentalgiana]